jgi:hypothetical protein
MQARNGQAATRAQGHKGSRAQGLATIGSALRHVSGALRARQGYRYLDGPPQSGALSGAEGLLANLACYNSILGAALNWTLAIISGIMVAGRKNNYYGDNDVVLELLWAARTEANSSSETKRLLIRHYGRWYGVSNV